MLLKMHTDDPSTCWCHPAMLLTFETKTVVHRWTLRDQFRTFWFKHVGWPPRQLDPILEGVRRSVTA